MTMDMHSKKPVDIRVFRGRAGLLELKPVWRQFESATSGLGFIHHYGWFRSYLESIGNGAGEVIFVLAMRESTPVAIFPLHRTVTRRFGIPLRTWELFWPNDMGICDYIFDKSEENRGLVLALTKYLRGNKAMAWDLLSLKDTLEDSCAQFAMKASCPPLAINIKHHYSKYIPCHDDYESTMGRLSGDFRRNLRRQSKKVAELGRIEYRFVSDAQEMEEAFRHFLHAEAASWKGDAGTKSAIQLYQDKILFYRTLVDEFSKYGACSINLILLNGECIASQFCLTVDDTLYLLKIGYSDEYKALGPGNVLLTQLIQRCCMDNRINKISFVTGASWNDRWAPLSLDVYEGSIFNRTWRGIIVYALEMLKDYGRQVKNRARTPAQTGQTGVSARERV